MLAGTEEISSKGKYGTNLVPIMLIVTEEIYSEENMA